MKALVLTHSYFDYGGSLLFGGLCNALHEENVFDYPYKPSYHGFAHEFVDYAGNKHTIYPYLWIDWHSSQYPREVTTDRAAQLDIVRDNLRKGAFDVVVLESLRSEAYGSFLLLKDDIDRSGVPVVLHDSSDIPDVFVDEFGTHYDPSQFNLVLKRELWKERYAGPRIKIHGVPVVGFPLSCPTDLNRLGKLGVKGGPKYAQLDFSFIMRRNHQDRQDVRDALRCFKEGFAHLCLIEADESASGWHNFMYITSDSTFGVNTRGFGLDTLRAWEIPVCTVLLSDKVGIHYEYPMIPDQHFKQYNSPAECLEIVRHFWDPPTRLERKEELHELYIRGRDFVLKYHTHTARARYLISLLEEYGLIGKDMEDTANV